jgi:hypothetical protein
MASFCQFYLSKMLICEARKQGLGESILGLPESGPLAESIESDLSAARCTSYSAS